MKVEGIIFGSKVKPSTNEMFLYCVDCWNKIMDEIGLVSTPFTVEKIMKCRMMEAGFPLTPEHLEWYKEFLKENHGEEEAVEMLEAREKALSENIPIYQKDLKAIRKEIARLRGFRGTVIL